MRTRTRAWKRRKSGEGNAGTNERRKRKPRDMSEVEQGVEERERKKVKARVSAVHCSIDDKGAGGMDRMDRMVIGSYTYLCPIRCCHPKRKRACVKAAIKK